MEVISKSNLKNDTKIQLLGIFSIILGGIGIGIVLGVIAIFLSKKTLREYHRSPKRYHDTSYGRVTVGRICAIIGIVCSFMMIFFVGMIILYAMGHNPPH